MPAQVISFRASPAHPTAAWSPRMHAVLHRVARSSLVAAAHRTLPVWQGYAGPVLVSTIATAITLCGWSWVIASALRLS